MQHNELFHICVRNLLRSNYGCGFGDDGHLAARSLVDEIVTYTRFGTLPRGIGLIVRRLKDTHPKYLQWHLKTAAAYGLPIVSVTVNNKLTIRRSARALNSILVALGRYSYWSWPKGKELVDINVRAFYVGRTGKVRLVDPFKHLAFLDGEYRARVGVKKKRGLVVTDETGRLSIKSGSVRYELGIGSFCGRWAKKLKGMIPSRTVIFRAVWGKDGVPLARDVRLAKKATRSQQQMAMAT